MDEVPMAALPASVHEPGLPKICNQVPHLSGQAPPSIRLTLVRLTWIKRTPFGLDVDAGGAATLVFAIGSGASQGLARLF